MHIPAINAIAVISDIAIEINSTVLSFNLFLVN